MVWGTGGVGGAEVVQAAEAGGGTTSVTAPGQVADGARFVCSAEGRSAGSLDSGSRTSGSSRAACFIGSTASATMAYAVSTRSRA